jgi:UDP-N-acetylglucosamine acyltransferase
VTRSIHPSALIDPTAELGDGIEIGAWVLVGPGVRIGDGCRLAPRVTLERNVLLAPEVQLGVGVVLGSPPQDIHYRDEETWVEVGRGTVIREYSTINRGSAATGRTVIGESCFLMSYVHFGHDCRVGDGVTVANATQVAGHVTIQDHANLSGLIAVHQFVTIGEYSFIGGATRVNQDVPPFVKAVGNPMELFGLNGIGLRRAGFDAETIFALKHAYRLIFNAGLSRSDGLERARVESPPVPEVNRFLAFLESSSRGVPA